MSVNNGPVTNTLGLVLCLDAANRKSNIKSLNNLIDNSAWQTAGPGTNNFPWPQNGDGNQNSLLYDTDPWGNSSLVLKTTPNNANANGGWDGCAPGYWINIDNSKKYRSCVWVRRTSVNTNGNFYHGLHTNSGSDIIQSDGTTNGNPYWSCQGIGYMTQNQWYLNVGHIFPYNSTPTVDPTSGYWTSSGTYVGNPGCNITGSDPRFPSDATLLRNRVYHYYAASDPNSNLEFFWPRIDLCDGTQPSIQEILNHGPSQWNDLESLGGSGTITKATYSSNNRGYFGFDGSGNQYINVYRSDLNGGAFAYSNITAIAWIWIDPTSAAGDNNIATVESAFEYRWNNNNNGTASVYYASNPWAWLGAGTVNTGVWQMITFRHGASTGDIWCNNNQIFSQAISGGIGAGTSSNPMLTLMGRSSGPGSPAKGNLALFKLYNRALSNDEIIQQFNAYRGRFGV
jgi:hypothetical protein